MFLGKPGTLRDSLPQLVIGLTFDEKSLRDQGNGWVKWCRVRALRELCPTRACDWEIPVAVAQLHHPVVVLSRLGLVAGRLSLAHVYRKNILVEPFTHKSCVPCLSSLQVFSESANHSRLQPAETATVVDGDEAARKGAVYADVAEGGKSTKLQASDEIHHGSI